MMHWCPDDTMVVLMSTGYLYAGYLWLRIKYYEWKHPKESEEEEDIEEEDDCS